MKKIILIAAAAFALCSCTKELADNGPVTEGDSTSTLDNGTIPGWVRIKLTEDAQLLNVGAFTRGAVNSGDSDLDKLAADLGATEIRRVFTPNAKFAKRHRQYGLHLWFDVKFDETVAVSRAMNQFEALPQIDIVEPIYKIVATDGADYIMPARDGFTVGNATRAAANAPFNDPKLGLQWHYNNDGSVDGSVAGADINMFKAWELYGAGDPSVIVSVIDSPIQTDHPDLAANIWVNKGEIPGNRIDDDGNGFIDDVNGWDFYNNSSLDESGSHGTHVAGTIAAVNNNGEGVCGVAGGTGNGDGVKIMSTAVYGADSDGDASPDGYIYAADNGAVISQNSWNYTPTSGIHTIPTSMSIAFKYFIDNAGIDKNGNQVGPMKGGVIIFSSGNNFADYAGVPSNDPRVICVASMMANYVKAMYSNFSEDVDIFAPGGSGMQDTEFSTNGGVYSTDINGGYAYKSGTSMACPHVSGVAALIISKFGGPEFTNKQLKERLLRSVRNVSKYQQTPKIALGLGAGLLDASLIDLQNPNTAPNKPATVTVTTKYNEEKIFFLGISVPADATGGYVAGFNISYAKKIDKDDLSKWKIDTLANNVDVNGKRETTITGLEDATDYIIRVNAYDRFGNKSDYTEATGRTIDHINRAPTHLAIINPIIFPIISGSNKSFETTLDLTEYFSDPDLPNDKLTFTVTSRDPTIATAEINGNILTVKAVQKDNTSLTVYAYDIVGAKISKGVTVQVNEDITVTGAVSIKKPFEPVSFPMTQGGVPVFETTFNLNDYFEGVANSTLSFNAISFNNSSVMAEVKDGSTLVIKAIAKGSAVVNVTASGADGGKNAQSITVTVIEAPKGGNTGGALSVYPNPVVDYVKISVSGAGAVSGQMKVYDSAARLVKRGDVDFVGDTMPSYDMKSLAPGMYTMVVSVAGREYKNTFVKK